MESKTGSKIISLDLACAMRIPLLIVPLPLAVAPGIVIEVAFTVVPLELVPASAFLPATTTNSVLLSEVCVFLLPGYMLFSD